MRAAMIQPRGYTGIFLHWACYTFCVEPTLTMPTTTDVAPMDTANYAKVKFPVIMS